MPEVHQRCGTSLSSPYLSCLPLVVRIFQANSPLSQTARIFLSINGGIIKRGWLFTSISEP